MLKIVCWRCQLRGLATGYTDHKFTVHKAYRSLEILLQYNCLYNFICVNIHFFTSMTFVMCINISLIGGGDCKRKGRKA